MRPSTRLVPSCSATTLMPKATGQGRVLGVEVMIPNQAIRNLIREDKVHAIVCTGANLEEDIFNLVAHDYYERVPHYRHLTAEDEVELVKRHMQPSALMM